MTLAGLRPTAKVRFVGGPYDNQVRMVHVEPVVRVIDPQNIVHHRYLLTKVISGGGAEFYEYHYAEKPCQP